MRETRKRLLNPRFLVLVLVSLTLLTGVVLWGRRAENQAASPEEAAVPDYVEEAFLTENEFSRPGTPLEEVHGVVIHYVGNPSTSAMANRNYFESLSAGTDGVYASSHFIVGLEGEVVQCIPLTEIAYASNSRNSDTIGIEVCHPDETGRFSSVTYHRVVELTAWLCETFQLDPETEVIRHYDVTGKLCPLYYVEHPEAWEQFLQDVQAALDASEDAR